MAVMTKTPKTVQISELKPGVSGGPVLEQIRGGSPDKTDSFDKLSRWPIILPANSLLKNDPKDTNPYTKVSAEPLLSGCFFICLHQEGHEYNIITDNAKSPLTVPIQAGNLINAAGISRGGAPMLREIIYNELMGLGKTEAVAKEWGAVAAEFEQVCGLRGSYTRNDVVTFLAHLRKRELRQSTILKDLKAIKVLARAQGWEFPKLPLKRVNPDEIRRTILSKKTVGSMITLGKQGILKNVELCFLALATTYGMRRVELARLTPASFPDGHHLIVDTAKGGRRTTHLVPPEIASHLSYFKPYEADSLTHMFHRIAKKCGIDTGKGYGWHSIRRSLITELILEEASALNVVRFMRWSDASNRGEFGMLAIYAIKDQKRIDEDIFRIHPFIGMWR